MYDLNINTIDDKVIGKANIQKIKSTKIFIPFVIDNLYPTGTYDIKVIINKLDSDPDVY